MNELEEAFKELRDANSKYSIEVLKLQAELQAIREQLEKAEGILKMYASRNNWNSQKEAVMLCEYVGGETARQYFQDKDKE